MLFPVEHRYESVVAQLYEGTTAVPETTIESKPIAGAMIWAIASLWVYTQWCQGRDLLGSEIFKWGARYFSFDRLSALDIFTHSDRFEFRERVLENSSDAPFSVTVSRSIQAHLSLRSDQCSAEQLVDANKNGA